MPSDTIGVAKAVATRTGFLEASQMEHHRKPRKLSSKGASRSNSKQKVGGVSSKVAIDVIPFHSTNYLPQVDDVVLGVVVQKNQEFFMLDINSASYAQLNSLEF